MKPLAITMGDACGVGPEIILKAFSRGLPGPSVVIGDPRLLAREAVRLRLPLDIATVSAPDASAASSQRARVPVIAAASLPGDLTAGAVDPRAGDAAYRCIAKGAALALRGEVRALVTAPISKQALRAAGHDYPGHTELLAQLAGDVPVRMMLANGELRTVLVTIHLALRDAIAALDAASIVATIRITDRALRAAGIESPRIAVAGLNPHAGEGGAFGREEIELIAPAIAAARGEGIDATGPHPPDTVFMRARGFVHHDVVVAMYHDQGLIPVKYLGIDEGVNITIGLPFVRTSPDHGTAFDIAGKVDANGWGLADERSLIAAIRHADALSRGA